jgi:hypothetical protein
MTRRKIKITGAAAAAAALLAGALALAGPAKASPTGCDTTPSSCGFPDATNTGVPSDVALTAVPGSATSGPGWSWDSAHGAIYAKTAGAAVSGLSCSCGIVVQAADVSIQDVSLSPASAASWAIELQGVTGTTIEHSTITGYNDGSGRVGSAILDSGSSSYTSVIDDNLSAFKTGIQISTGLIAGNYLHNFGYATGDHDNGIFADGGVGQLIISNNTILDQLTQTDAINLDSTYEGETANKFVLYNLLGGAGYPLYGGDRYASPGGTDPTANVVVEGNDFSQDFYTTSGEFGEVTDYACSDSGNEWAGNYTDDGTEVDCP